MHYKTEGVPLGFAICLSKHSELSGLGNTDFLLIYSLKSDGCISRKCHSLRFLFIYSHVLTRAKSSFCGSWPTWVVFVVLLCLCICVIFTNWYLSLQDAYRLQLKLFLYEVKQQQLLSGVRTFLKVYSAISVGKLANYMEVDEPTLRWVFCFMGLFHLNFGWLEMMFSTCCYYILQDYPDDIQAQDSCCWFWGKDYIECWCGFLHWWCMSFCMWLCCLVCRFFFYKIVLESFTWF